MTTQENLLGKYYKGETSLEEEQELKTLVKEKREGSLEGDIFAYYENNSAIPAGLEEDIFDGIQENVKNKKTIRMRLYSMVSAAAVVLILLSVFVDVRKTKRIQMEDNFFVMEQALFQVSESLQPPREQEEMLVLWVDNDVEIIIN